MSVDGSSAPRTNRPTRGGDRGVGQLALGVLLVLAVAATIVMVFSENPMWTRIGTLAALWAAFIGAFLVGRYRRLAAAEAARVRDLHTVYELQLEREISARREHELVVEKDLREQVRAETSDSVLALRQEIAALREQLSQLTGTPLGDERTAVGGSQRAGALGAAPSRTSVPSERVEPRGAGRTESAAARPAAAQPVPSQPARPQSEPAQTVAPQPSARPARPQPQPSQPARPQPQPQPQPSQPAPPRPAVRPSFGDSPSAAETTQQPRVPTPPRPAAPSRPAAAGSASSNRHSQGSSVADLLARLGSEATEPTQESSGGRRHRRRTED